MRCKISAGIDASTGQMEVSSEGWPQKLILQIMPRNLVQSIMANFSKLSKYENL